MNKDMLNNGLSNGNQIGESFKDIELKLANVKCGRNMLLRLFEFCMESMQEIEKQNDIGQENTK